jgi:hypothetical protein
MTEDSVDPKIFPVSPLCVSAHLPPFSYFCFHIHLQFLNRVRPNERVVKCIWMKFSEV